MKANNFNLWFRLTVGSAIGAIVYYFRSSGIRCVPQKRTGTAWYPKRSIPFHLSHEAKLS